MKYPKMNKTAKRTVTIPSLNGGMNLRDTKSGISDNQLSDSLNVWFKNGTLKTRPNFETNPDMCISCQNVSKNDIIGSKVHKDIEYNGMLLCSTAFFDTNNLVERIIFYWQGGRTVLDFGYVEFRVTNNERADYFVTSYKDTVYLYLKNKKIYKKVFGSGASAFIEVTESPEDRYIPTVYTNALRVGEGVMPEFKADMLEGYNLIGKYAKIVYSTVNPEYSRSDKSNMMMIYTLPPLSENTTAASYSGYKIIVKHTTDSGTATHTVTLNQSGVGEETTVQSDGLKIRCVGRVITFKDAQGSIKIIDNNAQQILNNLEIIYPHFVDDSKIFGCRFSEWYGGVSEGINGGTRLFVSGNSDNGSTVYWSDLNNPLYFPENNYFLVGTTGSRVTAFGKQNDKLVIFKENETWYTEYTQTTSPNASDIKNQSFVDLTTANAKFPLVLINDRIGCDCENTVELCRNRLVFLNSNGKVYVIVTMNQFSENNIYEIGGMVENRLKREENLKGAMSADFNGHYSIIVGRNMYLCDYNSYGFQYAYSFKNEDDIEIKIPWYFWKFPFEGKYFSFKDFIIFGKWDALNENSDTYYSSSVIGAYNSSMVDKMLLKDFRFSENAEFLIQKGEILSEFTSKLFNFGSPEKRKNIERVSIFTGDNEGQKVTVTFLSENGNETNTYFLNSNEMSECKTILPTLKGVSKFGIKMSSNGKLNVEGITLLYRMLGVIR